VTRHDRVWGADDAVGKITFQMRGGTRSASDEVIARAVGDLVTALLIAWGLTGVYDVKVDRAPFVALSV
jgi:hypothetical protein